MTMIELMVTGTHARARVLGELTGGLVGLPVVIRCDGSWDGLCRTLVCKSAVDDRRGQEIRTVPNVGDEAVVAHEVMIPGRQLFLGLEGRSPDGTVIVPTVWADCGKIKPGANADADETLPATPEAWAQILTQLGNLSELDTDHKETLVSAINEAMTKGNGLPGQDGRGIRSVEMGENGAWIVTYEDGRSQTVSNEAYLALTEQVWELSLEMADKTQLSPAFAQDLSGCVDKTKVYVLPDGLIYAHFQGEEAKELYTDRIPTAQDNDGTVYNQVGYKAGVRWSVSDKMEKPEAGASITGWIPVQDGDVVRIANMPINKGAAFASNQNNVAMANGDKSNQWNFYTTILPQLEAAEFDEAGNLIRFTITSGSGIRWIRFTAQHVDENSVVTVNEVIASSVATETGWRSTGHAFVPADYEDRILALEKTMLGRIYGIVDEDNDILLAGDLPGGTYILKYQNSDGTVTEIGSFDV